MWPFGKNKLKIKVLVTNYLQRDKVLSVYDNGNGAYVKSYFSKTPRYLKPDGTFENPEFHECNGDPC